MSEAAYRYRKLLTCNLEHLTNTSVAALGRLGYVSQGLDDAASKITVRDADDVAEGAAGVLQG